MRKALKNNLLIVFLSLLMFAGCNSKQEHVHEEDTRFTCPMHPQIVAKEPGICPICRMELVPLSGPGQVSSNDSLKYLVKPTNELVQSSIATVKPQKGKRFMQDSIRGIINYNSNNWNSISSRVGGRIERLYIKYNYQPISKGQKIMDIYSPDLANAQQELLFLKQNNEPKLLELAMRKLSLLGMSTQQITTVLKSGNISYRTSIYSLYSGFISEGSTVENSSVSGTVTAGGTMIGDTDTEDSMSGATAIQSSSVPKINGNTPLSIREGQYVSNGQKLFDIINASSVWAEFFLRPEQLQSIKKGTPLKVISINDPSQKADVTVNLVQPYFNEGINFTVARAQLNNPQRNWRVGQIVNVNTTSGGTEGNWIPRKAVLQLGNRYVIFIKENGGFKPVYAEVLKTAGDWIDVGSLLPPETEIAANAWFLVDSESFIKPDRIQ